MRLLSGAFAVLAILLTSSVVRAGSDAGGKGTTAPAPATSSAKRTETPAAPANAPAPAAGSSSASQTTAPQTGSTTTGETLEEIVARVRRRLASEQSRTVKPPAPTRTPAPPPEPRERVSLVWRPSLVWPSSLTGEEQPGAEDERVTLSWGAEAEQ